MLKEVFTFSPKHTVSKYGFIVGNYGFQNWFDGAILVSINMSFDIYFVWQLVWSFLPKNSLFVIVR